MLKATQRWRRCLAPAPAFPLRGHLTVRQCQLWCVGLSLPTRGKVVTVHVGSLCPHRRGWGWGQGWQEVLRQAGWAPGDFLSSQTLSKVAQGTPSLQGVWSPCPTACSDLVWKGGGWLAGRMSPRKPVCLLWARGAVTELPIGRALLLGTGPGAGPLLLLGVRGDGSDLMGFWGPKGIEACYSTGVVPAGWRGSQCS